MRHIITVIGVAAVLALTLGCSGVATFPDNGAAAVSSGSEFGVLVAKPDTYQGRAIRLAGRIVDVETTDRGTMIIAEWLPFPVPGQNGPGMLSGKEPGRFTLLYAGKLDPMSTMYGNKFVVAGAVKGTKDMITWQGTSESVPYVEARCLHVWKSGAGEVADNVPDTEASGFPALEQTYCAHS